MDIRVLSKLHNLSCTAIAVMKHNKICIVSPDYPLALDTSTAARLQSLHIRKTMHQGQTTEDRTEDRTEQRTGQNRGPIKKVPVPNLLWLTVDCHSNLAKHSITYKVNILLSESV